MEPNALLDVDVLLALVGWDHVDPARVVRWHREWPDQWLLCPLSKAGLLRLSPNPADPRLVWVWEKVRGNHQVMAALFLGTAIASEIRLATMDQGLRSLAEREDRVVQIP